MSEPSENKMALFNECMVTLYLYTLISLTDYNSVNNWKEECGILLSTIVILSFMANFFKILGKVGHRMYLRVKGKI